MSDLRRAVEALEHELSAGDVVATDEYTEGWNDQGQTVAAKLRALLAAHPCGCYQVSNEEYHCCPDHGGTALSHPPAPKQYVCKECGMTLRTEGVVFPNGIRKHWNNDYTSGGLLSPRWCGPIEEVINMDSNELAQIAREESERSVAPPAKRWRCACGWEGTAGQFVEHRSNTTIDVSRCGPVVEEVTP
ncbi:MAG: hypothetical protein IMZ71_00350 [Chloroflexi bacterium]|nr:hypothetical protein [Chloroflexota bacterium]